MRLALSIAALALTAPALAMAQSAPPSEATEGWTMQLGGALIAGPAWQGSDKTAVSLFPDVRVSYGDRFFASIPEGVGYNLLSDGDWRAGPIAKIRFGRDEEDGGSPFRISGESDELRGLGDIDTAGEVGVFVERRFGDDAAWRLRGEVRQGFGGHEGVVADASLIYQTRLGSTLISMGPGSASPPRTTCRPTSASIRPSRPARAWPSTAPTAVFCPMAWAPASFCRCRAPAR